MYRHAKFVRISYNGMEIYEEQTCLLLSRYWRLCWCVAVIVKTQNFLNIQSIRFHIFTQPSKPLFVDILLRNYVHHHTPNTITWLFDPSVCGMQQFSSNHMFISGTLSVRTALLILQCIEMFLELHTSYPMPQPMIESMDPINEDT